MSHRQRSACSIATKELGARQMLAFNFSHSRLLTRGSASRRLEVLFEAARNREKRFPLHSQDQKKSDKGRLTPPLIHYYL